MGAMNVESGATGRMVLNSGFCAPAQSEACSPARECVVCTSIKIVRAMSKRLPAAACSAVPGVGGGASCERMFGMMDTVASRLKQRRQHPSTPVPGRIACVTHLCGGASRCRGRAT